MKLYIEVQQSPGREDWNGPDNLLWRGGLRQMAGVGLAQGQKLWTFMDLRASGRAGSSILKVPSEQTFPWSWH